MSNNTVCWRYYETNVIKPVCTGLVNTKQFALQYCLHSSTLTMPLISCSRFWSLGKCVSTNSQYYPFQPPNCLSVVVPCAFYAIFNIFVLGGTCVGVSVYLIQHASDVDKVIIIILLYGGIAAVGISYNWLSEVCMQGAFITHS